MKKILGISLIAILSVSPMIAGAATVAEADPGATVTQETLMTAGLTETEANKHLEDITASVEPKYALKAANTATDTKAASAGYVKGAYNAIIKGVNAVQDDIDTLNYNIDHVGDGYAKHTGVEATIKAATVTEGIEAGTTSVALNTINSTSASVKASGTIGVSIDIMDDWVNDAQAQNPVTADATFSNVDVSSVTLAVGNNTESSGTVSGGTFTTDIVDSSVHSPVSQGS